MPAASFGCPALRAGSMDWAGQQEKEKEPLAAGIPEEIRKLRGLEAARPGSMVTPGRDPPYVS